MILAILDDLIFRSKLEAAAKQLETPLTVVSEAGDAVWNGATWSLVLIDLNLTRGNVLAMIHDLREAYPGTPIIGYCSHVERNLQQQAIEAGCTTVMARSAFVQQIPELLRVA